MSVRQKDHEGIRKNMNTFQKIISIINILAVLVIPVVAVVVGQKLQEKAEKRKDKMKIFQCLMTRRTTSWANPDAVDALNTIDIVFSDCDAVRSQWHTLLNKYRPEIPRQEQWKEECKLLELMANDLGYKGKITWETIQSPYYPLGLDQQIARNIEISKGQEAIAKAADTFVQLIVAQFSRQNAEHREDNTNANA